MSETLVGLPAHTWPDAELVAVDHLRTLIAALPGSDPLASTTVGTVVPAPSTVPFLRVQRVGGTQDGTVDTARLLVEAWSDTKADAAVLAAAMRDWMRRLVGVVDGWTVTRTVEIGGPASIADPITDTPRQLLTFETSIRAQRA